MTRIRPVRPGDRKELTAMLARCTAQARYRRFHGVTDHFPEHYLAGALAGDPRHVALVAFTPAAIVALASCVTQPDGSGELAILVQDACQRHGLGSRLLRRLVEHADCGGQQILRASVLAEQSWIRRLLSTYGSCETEVSDGVMDITLYRKDT